MTTVISVENLSKIYRLGQFGTGTFTNDLKVWWATARRKPNPLLRIGQGNDDKRLGEELWALRDINFTVEQGQVLGIIGRNGAGKSTLLKILSRVTAPTFGRIKVKGHIASLLEVGTGFHPELTGRENIYLNGAILGMTRKGIDRQFSEIVDFSGVEKFIDTPVKRYSSGMYVRLAFAVAAYLEPEILVIDEVLAVGDAEFQKRCLGKMGEVAKAGRTVLFVSHNMVAVQKLCTSSLLIEDGKILAAGNTPDVITGYLNRARAAVTQKIPLIARKDRNGTGVMRFTNVEFLNEKQDALSIPQTGNPLAISLEYECGDLSLQNTVILLAFYNSDGYKLFDCLSRDAYPEVARLQKNGRIICYFPRLPLLSGIYFVDIWCKVNEMIADELNNAFTVEVTNGDYFGTGKINPGLHDGLLADHYWEFLSL